MFSKMDRNKDGVVTEADFRAYLKSKGIKDYDTAHRIWKAASARDKNNDGIVTRSEYSEFDRWGFTFNTMDVNKDGKITKDDVRAYFNKKKGR